MSEAPKRVWISPPSVLSQSERVRFAYEAPNDEVEFVYISAAVLRDAIEMSVTKGDALDAIEKLLEGED